MAAADIRIVSVGSVVQDVFLRSQAFTPHKEGNDYVEEFKLGEKYEVDDVIFSTGGGASNAAVTFSRQGFHSTFIGKVGNDALGRMIMDELHTDHVETGHVHIVDGLQSGYSTLLLSPTGERSILVFHGGSTDFEPADFDMTHLDADWMYLSTFTGNYDVLEHLLQSAQQKGIKVAFNPGKGELADLHKLRSILPYLTILSLNKEEMQQLYHGETPADLVRAAHADVPYVVVTDGPKGVAATDGQKVCIAGMYEDVPVLDRTGAGDAFSSGFTAMIALGESLEKAITFGSANSTSVVQTIGAKVGILPQSATLHEMPIETQGI